MRRARLALAALALGTACAGDPTAPDAPTPTPTPVTPPPPPSDTAPTPRREFRGAWVATVSNVDWPSRAGLPAAQQQTELRNIVRNYVQTNLNAMILQVRPAADALYASPYEPWSRYLTGTQGVDPGYDPLAFAVKEAHAAGLELHAWFNPFRAGLAADTARFAATHVWRARRDLARVYGTQLWMDPGDPEVVERTVQVILDVVRRYDVDAVHIDDYFYPYQERDPKTNAILDFPDSATYARFNPRNLARADWRRDNINRFVERLYRQVHAVKPWVRVGISPFGIWRPGNPPGITGLDAYADIYADSRLWLTSGWADYLAPQLYWAIGAPQQSYTALNTWWALQNVVHMHLWPGVASYRVRDGTTSAFLPNEISDQVAVTRTIPGAPGNIFYNTTSLFSSVTGVARQLVSTVYQVPTLPPATPWLDPTPPGAPTVTATEGTPTAAGRVWTVHITPPAGEAVRWWVIQPRVAGQWTGPVVAFGDQLAVDLTLPSSTGGGRLEMVGVSGADAVWNVGLTAYWRPPAVAILHPR
ncbi:protein of unknown function DUF187 [Gemmatirosa kalamazoonensis]|uniref:Glycosyl hydrolase-like 10 domain-containing protein n=1 Tax=Gemmatirosa kalamazoonensis TaxID=861299 RepID=W0RPR8_9BACT|nr:family 10 glycosylhydrolase [Gemmatirosa kalamazoonensis]AHG91503.1 protein of unknown function DUF187 [Gemmatirosa kalamazoonensis]